VRIYLPGTFTTLRALVDSGELSGPPPITAFAVTPSLREWYVDGDIDELEYAALLEAARGSLRLLEEDPLTPRRRVVVAADVPDADILFRPDLDRAVVHVGRSLPLRLVASVHVDGADAERAVRAAVAAVLEADLGGEDAQFLVDEAEGHELLWYAPQEIPALLELG
jgi:Family of unknown function (DUF6912)